MGSMSDFGLSFDEEYGFRTLALKNERNKEPKKTLQV
jgi:hypothetical protein